MHYVYIIRSLSVPEKLYYGVTSDLKNRLQSHNRKEVRYTSSFAPWEIVSYTAFKDKQKAFAIEKYLKSHSGRAFAKKRFL